MRNYEKQGTACLFCRSTHIQKNGVLPRGGQRYTCTVCSKHFTVGGAGRGTYDEHFKKAVVHEYCHNHHAARTVAKHHHLSTSTIIQRAKEHKKCCDKCH